MNTIAATAPPAPGVPPPLTATQPAAVSQVTEKVLKNGLRVLVKQDHRAPIATMQVWYRVGSSYEHDGVTGISHLLEHMMFKGTEKVGPGEFSRIIAENGGDENAFTSRDYTAYFQTIATDRLAIAFELEADRMRQLALPEAEFLKELEVVKEERRLRTDDDPESLAYEHFNATAFVAAPYRIPIIGWASDLDTIAVDDLRNWYRRWYAPNNATLIVVGDVTPPQVFSLAEQYFGGLQAEQITPPKSRTEPPQFGEKRIVVKAPANEPYLLFGYKTPVLLNANQDAAWEPYALEMLAAILDGGESARFSRELIRGQQLAAAASASYSAFSRLPDLFLFEGMPAQGHDLTTLEAAMIKQIERVQRQAVTPEELTRARNQLIAAKVYEQDSVFYQAMQLGQLETVGLGWQLADQYLAQLTAITPAQIQAVAKKYLIPDQRTVAILHPLPLNNDDDSDHAAPAAARGHGYVR
ncbi:M16 family metallopeptidase [Thiospirillum jenense]|uniref:Insulinase family protein n=1 Tax=Thiospirillum jenense TaxID=1653858 RepID=A0A839HCG2_9GAMM|nr:insulinase family protein [Thiospirillum jenense]